MIIETERLYLSLASDDEMKRLVEQEENPILKKAYSEMHEGAKSNPPLRDLFAAWFMKLKDDDETVMGNLSFKGISEDGMVDIGYGIHSTYENKGYTTEAVKALVQWVLQKPQVTRVEAEAEEENLASIKVLTKAGFVRNGAYGEEGPRFLYRETLQDKSDGMKSVGSHQRFK